MQAASRNQLHLSRRAYGPRVRLFFDQRPLLAAPALDRCIVTLTGALNWFLYAPANRSQQAANMVGMIADAELTLDHSSNPLLGPDIAHKAVGWCATPQALAQALALVLRQLGRCSRTRSLAQRGNSACSCACDP